MMKRTLTKSDMIKMNENQIANGREPFFDQEDIDSAPEAVDDDGLYLPEISSEAIKAGIEKALKFSGRENEATITDEQIKAVIKEEIKKYPTVNVIVRYGLSRKVRRDMKKVQGDYADSLKVTPIGATYCKALHGCDKIEFFINGVKLQQVMFGFTDEQTIEMLKSTIRHEFRHYEQLQYLYRKGGYKLCLSVAKAESENAWGAGILERDAIATQLGYNNNFDKLFKKFINQ